MVRQDAGTVLFVPLLIITMSLMLLPTAAMAQVVPGEEDMRQEPVTVNEHFMQYAVMTPEIEKQVDGLMDAIFDIHSQNYLLGESSSNKPINDIIEHNNNVIDELLSKIDEVYPPIPVVEQSSSNKPINDIIEHNNNVIDELLSKIDEVYPPIPVVEISKEDEKRMHDAMLRLAHSDLPLLGMGIEPSTGLLAIEVNIDEAGPDIEESIRNFTHDIPLSIYYGEDDAEFQGSCNPNTKYCDPLVGGSLGQDEYWGLPCTVSIAAERNTRHGIENGVIIPDHCNPNSSRYYQADNDLPSHLVGNETKDGGWFCDCDFVNSNTREIDPNKISIGSSDSHLFGKSDLSMNAMVRAYGAVSGSETGRIVATNQWKNFDGNWFSDLYKISDINFTTGDSGAPIIGENKHYVGMNIGEEYGFNFAHDWSFLKSKLGLRN